MVARGNQASVHSQNNRKYFRSSTNDFNPNDGRENSGYGAIHKVSGERVDETKRSLIGTKGRWEGDADGGPNGGERGTTLGPVTRLY